MSARGITDELVQRVASLPDANKRAAFLLTARFLDANDVKWGPSDVDVDAGLVERVADGEATHDEVVAWIRQRPASAPLV